MNKNDSKRIRDSLNSFEPEFNERDTIIRSVMDSTERRGLGSASFNLFDILFSWFDYPWVRRGMLTVSMAIIFIFTSQQLTIINRIDRLEDRMVNSNTQLLLKHQGEKVIMNSVLLMESDKGVLNDSILVADKDLRELIDSYTDLQSRYQQLQEEYKERDLKKVKL